MNTRPAGPIPVSSKSFGHHPDRYVRAGRSRRAGRLIHPAARACLVLAIALLVARAPSTARAADADSAVFAPPASPRQTFSFDTDWNFIRKDAPGAENPNFDDTNWQTVSTPHTYNDIDTFNKIISHGGGQQGQYTGYAWYRKHFTLPASAAGQKVFIEFQGMRQAGDIFLNGKAVGLSENGVTAYGIDLTPNLNFTGDNLLAVRVTNDTHYAEKATHATYEWESRDFNPDYGGLNRHVLLHITGKIHQTLPIYDGLATTGIYVYPSNIDVANKAADINIEAQVQNESGDQASITLSAVIVDARGNVAAKFDGDTSDLVDGEKDIFKATGHLDNARLWSPEDPYLYTVYTILNVNGQTADVAKTITGFRKVEFRGGAGTGGIYINDKFVYLTGYSQRSSDEWAGLGQAYPDWMHDLTAKLIRDSNANYVRWMHISPQATDVAAYDRFGIANVCPAGDKERDAQGANWDQRMNVMRDSMIYYRSSPSVFFWEAGNNGVSADHLQQMLDLKQQLDPNGMRAMGCRSLGDPATTSIAEYFGIMIGQDPRTDALKKPTDMFRTYSAERRDRAPFIETEDFRDEAARRFWDDYSPPHFGFKPGPNDVYKWNSETFSVAAAERYWEYYSNRISNTDPRHAKWSGYASIYFSDSNADGRQDSSEVCRVSGKVDAVRIPKDAYFTYRVIQNPRPDIHIIGHWTYPAGTIKTMYVISNCDAVELSVNGNSIARVDHAKDGYVFAFPDVHWTPGTITATGYKDGVKAAEDQLKTAGPASAIKLTPIVGPGGLRADGADVALFDVEVVDTLGQRCPTDEARVDFEISGPGIWRGGYNSGIVGSTNNKYLLTECGINRVSIKSTLTPGTITLTARRTGLTPATVQVTAAPFPLTGGLSPEEPRRDLPLPGGQ